MQKYVVWHNGGIVLFIMGTPIPGKMVFILNQGLGGKGDTKTKGDTTVCLSIFLRLGLYDHTQFQEASLLFIDAILLTTTDLTQEVKDCWFNWALKFNLIWLTCHLTLDDLADLWTVWWLLCPQPLVYCYGLNTASCFNFLGTWVPERKQTNQWLSARLQ